MEKTILGADFLHKYNLLLDLYRCCLVDTLCTIMAKIKKKIGFLQALFQITEIIMSSSFQKEMLLHDNTHHIITNGPSIHNCKQWHTPDK